MNEWMNLKKEYKYTYDTLSAMRLTQNKKNSVNSILYYGHLVQNNCFVVFTALQLPYLILRPNLMIVQNSWGNVPHTHEEIIRRVITFKYVKLRY